MSSTKMICCLLLRDIVNKNTRIALLVSVNPLVTPPYVSEELVFIDLLFLRMYIDKERDKCEWMTELRWFHILHCIESVDNFLFNFKESDDASSSIAYIVEIKLPGNLLYYSSADQTMYTCVLNKKL